MLINALKKAGHECIEAGNGLEGIEAFQGESPDCVFSDLLMPIMDGFEMAGRIRELNPATPIVIATADIQVSSRQRCEAIGVTKLVNKPLQPDEIAAAIDEAIAAVEVRQAVEVG